MAKKKVKAVKKVVAKKKKIVAKKVAVKVSKPRILFMDSDAAAARIKTIEKTGRKIAIVDVESQGFVYTGEEGKEPVVCLSYATPNPGKLKVADLIGNAALRSGLYKVNEVKPSSEILASTPAPDETHVTADTVKAVDEASEAVVAVDVESDLKDNDLPF